MSLVRWYTGCEISVDGLVVVRDDDGKADEIFGHGCLGGHGCCFDGVCVLNEWDRATVPDHLLQRSYKPWRVAPLRCRVPLLPYPALDIVGRVA